MPIIERVGAELPVALKTTNYTLVEGDIGTEIQFQSLAGVSANQGRRFAQLSGFSGLTTASSGTSVILDWVSGELWLDADSSIAASFRGRLQTSYGLISSDQTDPVR